MNWHQHLLFLIVWSYANGDNTNRVWNWECKNKHCQKVRAKPGSLETSLAACQITCDPFGTVWPRPTGKIELGGKLDILDTKSMEIIKNKAYEVSSLVKAAYHSFEIRLKHYKTTDEKGVIGKIFSVKFDIKESSQSRLKLNTNESYALRISESDDGCTLNATISAPTFFGGRHGLETLEQLIIYDEALEKLRIPSVVYITDEPVYPYRGVLLDTGRNYISVNAIKRTIDAISASKLNTLHWHIVDSASFPYVSVSNPSLSRLGAYSPSQVYTPKDVENIAEYARDHGVRIVPEFNAPAHVGEGWQDTNFVLCFDRQPWSENCHVPPCGQFDPTQPKLYDALEGIYKDLIKHLNPDIFHMGGDQTAMSCWDSHEHIQNFIKSRGWSLDEEGYLNLWNTFQTQALERLDRQTGEKLPIIVWSNNLTKEEYIDKYLPKNRYIIQIWGESNDVLALDAIKKGYRWILSNHNGLYLDCGFASWFEEGNNWCSPYHGWQRIYDSSPSAYGDIKQFLGSVAAMWTEQADDFTIDSRIWPRGAALAERLWSNPESSWQYAENRMLIHRDRLVKRGIGAEALQPQWCQQNDKHCPKKPVFASEPMHMLRQ